MLEWLELVLLASGPRNAFQVLPLRLAMLQELFIQGAMSGAEGSLAGSRLAHAVVHHLTEAEACCWPEIDERGSLVGIHPQDLLNFVGLLIHKGDITSGQDLPRRFDGAGKAVASTGGNDGVVKMGGDK